jgi:hypothetical protein
MYSDQPPMEGPSSEPYYPQQYDYSQAPYHPANNLPPNAQPVYTALPGPGVKFPPQAPYYPPMMMPNGYSMPDYGQQRMEMTWQSYAPPPQYPPNNPQISRGRRSRANYNHNHQNSSNGRYSRGYRRNPAPVFHQNNSFEQTKFSVRPPEPPYQTVLNNEKIPSSHQSETEQSDFVNVASFPASSRSTEKTSISPPPEEEFKADLEELVLDQPDTQSSPTRQHVESVDTAFSWCISYLKPDPTSAFPVSTTQNYQSCEIDPYFAVDYLAASKATPGSNR